MALTKAKDMKFNKMTKGSCTTRFWSSQYDGFKTIIQCYAAYTEAFRAFGHSEFKEFEILGVDFVIDLCAVVDVND